MLTAEGRHLLPRTIWIATFTAVLGAGYAAFHWHFLRTGPTWIHGTITWSLDLERALAQAKLQRKPVLLYFSIHGSAHDLSMENGVLNSGSVENRLAAFQCAALPVDRGPFAVRNAKLHKAIFEEVYLPAFVIVGSDYDPTKSSGGKDVLSFCGMAGESDFIQFLDRTIEKWREAKGL